LRPAGHLIGLACLLIWLGSSLGAIAYELHLRLHHSLLGFVVFLLPVAGLACLAVAALSWRRAARNARR
jgi:hypothetical protein